MFSGHKPASGTKSGYSLSEEALRALQSGDTQALINSHRTRFAGWKMEDDGGDGGGDSGSGDDGNDSGDSGSGDDGGDDNGDGTGGDDDEKVSKAELDKAMDRLRAADRRASKAENDLKAINDAKKDDLTKAQDRVTELEQEVETHKETVTSLRLENAFLTANKHTWHKPAAALALARSEGYLSEVMNDDGTVDNKKMGSALDKLAKDNAYLVKTAGSGASGESGGGRSDNGKDDKAIKEADARRAPALNRRR